MPTAFAICRRGVFYHTIAPTGLVPLPAQQALVSALERERALVSAARALVSVMEEKIKNLIGGLWERAG